MFAKNIGSDVNFWPFSSVTVVMATAETLYPITVFDAMKIIRNIHALFEVDICIFSTFHETVESYLNRENTVVLLLCLQALLLHEGIFTCNLQRKFE